MCDEWGGQKTYIKVRSTDGIAFVGAGKYCGLYPALRMGRNYMGCFSAPADRCLRVWEIRRQTGNRIWDLSGVQYYVFPNGPKILASSFTIIVSYARKIFPCLIVGTMVLQKTPVRELMVALRKWHIPQGLIIPLSVTVRYFPALKEETSYIRDAMKLRNIHGVQKIECLLVPTMISATTTAEELSAAAVTRGIENPAPKTSMIEMKFGVQDFLCLAAGLIFCVISITVG